MSLPDTIKAIQREVGAEPDGVFGPVTASLVWRALHDVDDETQAIPGGEGMDARSRGVLDTLDTKAQAAFLDFYRLANATAATLGCSYILISGNRTWDVQDDLYAQGRTQPGQIVTKARAGQSNHNFGIAGDFGVFSGKVYLDVSKPDLAAKVHKACSMHAADCGLGWGGSWKSNVDMPHYEIATGLSMAQKREKFKAKGSVL